jgi:hypothetical protein
MTKSQKNILTESINLMELIYKLQSDQNKDIFKDEIIEAVLMMICANRAVLGAIKRQEIEIANNIINQVK